MRVLVTGGAGFIGSSLVDELAADGHGVVVLDDLSTGSRTNLVPALTTGRVRLATGDVVERAPAVVAELRPDLVYHLAAQIDVRRSVLDPVADARSNVLGTVAIAKAAADAGCRRLVFASSGGTVYGEADPAELPVPETAPARPTNPYGVAKRSAEDYLRSFTASTGLETVSLRFANVYGPRQDPYGEAGVVAIFCNRLLAGIPVTIFGDGSQTRDFVFVGDAVRALLLAGAVAGVAGTALNIGTGRQTSVTELYAVLRRVTGLGGEPELVPARAGELRQIALDPSLAGELLGWHPEVELTEGLERTWAWAFQEVNAGSVGG